MKLTDTLARVLIIVCALTVLAWPATAQDEPSAAMRRALEFIEAVNDGGADVLEAFVLSTMNEEFRSALPTEQHVSILSTTHERGAPFEVGEVSADADNRVELLLHSARADQWMSLSLSVEAAAPHLISGLGLGPASAPLTPSHGAVYSDDEIRAEMTRLLDELVQSERFSGAVLMVRNGEVVFEAVRGEANKDFAVANRIDTKFNLGSMNKMFTAVAIAQLVEHGELSYDDPLSKFLPDFPDPESAAKIRIKHLLTHTGGLGSYFNEEFMQSSRARFRTVSELMTLAEGETMQFEPGSRWSYSNTGFLVLGRVIEVVTGQDYHDYIRDNVTGPAGMDSTECYELDQVNPNLAVGYDLQDTPEGRSWRNNIFMHVIRGGPAGGGYSTVGDLVRFADALRKGTLISEETFEVLASPKPELSSDRYGYGFGIGPSGGVGHSGGFSGINSELVFWPEGQWTIAVMSNYSGGAQPVVERARRLVTAGR